MTIRYLAIATLLFSLAGCSGNNGTNPFLQTDGGESRTDAGGDTAGGDCPGCIDSDGSCVNGDRSRACGAGGGACVECLPDQVCAPEGVCVDQPDCNPDSCDGCCDDNGECVDGNADMACGTGGLSCSSCEGDTSCVDGRCERGCSPDSCEGCCDADGECVSGETDTKCGDGGGTCTDCQEIGARCDGTGSCVEPGCADTCDGCCADGECIMPPHDEQCGLGGAACVDCGDNRTCIDGGCTVDPASLWKVFIANGDVAPRKQNGEVWDEFQEQPDPWVTAVAVDPDSGEEHRNWTPTEDNTFSPEWNDAPITVPARALFDGLRLEYMDEDIVDHDEICIFELSFDADSPAFDGDVMEEECADQPESKLRWKLQPQ